MNWLKPNRLFKFCTPIYLLVLKIHRTIYDWKIIVPFKPNQPTLILGNLHSGGTGKTPLAIWILNKIKDKIPNSSYVSRGYGSKSWKTQKVESNSRVSKVGDEARMLRSKFSSDISIVVARKRRRAFPLINPDSPVILDDAFQHWDLKGPLSVLICPYKKWYTNELVIPAGPLREPSSEANRATAIIVTKCPREINEYERLEIREILRIKKDQRLFCAQETMGAPAPEFNSPAWTGKEAALVVAGIGNPQNYFAHVKNSNFFSKDGNAVGFLNLEDHAKWNSFNINKVLKAAKRLHCNTLILTEKDIARLDNLPSEWSSFSIYSIPHELNFGDDERIFLSWLKDQWKAHGYNLPL